MEFEFDKEIDALLRQTARGETVSANSPSPHLDADEIALFAENALSEKTKALYSEHFADCDRCRKILSNAILLNAETVVETARPPLAVKNLNAAPWYRRFFAAPSLAYGMGALLLVFAGLIAFTFLQNAPDSPNSEIAKVEPTEKTSGPSAGESAPVIESNQMAMSNGGSMMSSNSAMTNSGSVMSNSAAAGLPPVASSQSGSMSNGATVSNSSAASAEQSTTTDDAAKSRVQSAINSMANSQNLSADNGASFAEPQKPVASEEKTRVAADDDAVKSDASALKPALTAAKRSAPVELPVNGRNASDLKNARAKKSKSDASETRAAGGKTFRRENGVWYDTNYTGQSTTNVARSSEDFKKLDGGLRSIAANLSGAVVIVYNGRAYRIQ